MKEKLMMVDLHYSRAERMFHLMAFGGRWRDLTDDWRRGARRRTKNRQLQAVENQSKYTQI